MSDESACEITHFFAEVVVAGADLSEFGPVLRYGFRCRCGWKSGPGGDSDFFETVEAVKAAAHEHLTRDWCEDCDRMLPKVIFRLCPVTFANDDGSVLRYNHAMCAACAVKHEEEWGPIGEPHPEDETGHFDASGRRVSLFEERAP